MRAAGERITDANYEVNGFTNLDLDPACSEDPITSPFALEHLVQDIYSDDLANFLENLDELAPQMRSSLQEASRLIALAEPEEETAVPARSVHLQSLDRYEEMVEEIPELETIDYTTEEAWHSAADNFRSILRDSQQADREPNIRLALTTLDSVLSLLAERHDLHSAANSQIALDRSRQILRTLEEAYEQASSNRRELSETLRLTGGRASAYLGPDTVGGQHVRDLDTLISRLDELRRSQRSVVEAREAHRADAFIEYQASIAQLFSDELIPTEFVSPFQSLLNERLIVLGDYERARDGFVNAALNPDQTVASAAQNILRAQQLEVQIAIEGGDRADVREAMEELRDFRYSLDRLDRAIDEQASNVGNYIEELRRDGDARVSLIGPEGNELDALSLGNHQEVMAMRLDTWGTVYQAALFLGDETLIGTLDNELRETIFNWFAEDAPPVTSRQAGQVMRNVNMFLIAQTTRHGPIESAYESADGQEAISRGSRAYNNTLEVLDHAFDLMEQSGLERVRGNEAFESAATACLLYTSPSPRDRQKSRMPSSA
jgi:hypothetical protein